MRIVCQSSILAAVLITLVTTIATADSPATMPTTMPTTAPTSINWDQTKDYIGQSVTVTGPVMGVHDFGGAAVLNVGKDYPDPSRFTVYIPADKRTGMPDGLDNGKTISVTGTLKTFHDVPEIEAGPADITVINQNPAGAATQP
jgi:hypothetical protein